MKDQVTKIVRTGQQKPNGLSLLPTANVSRKKSLLLPCAYMYSVLDSESKQTDSILMSITADAWHEGPQSLFVCLHVYLTCHVRQFF